MITKDLVTLVIKSEGADKVTVDLDKLAKGVKQIELEAKDAKGAIQLLKDENKNLAASAKREAENIKLLSKEIRELEKAGDTGSKKLKALYEAQENARLRSLGYKKQIEENNATIQTAGHMREYLIRTMKLEDMTMAQLSSRADYLRGKLNNIVKKDDLTKWNQYNNQLIATENQMKKVAIGGVNVKMRFGQLAQAAQEAGKTIGKVFLLMMVYQVIRFFTDLINKAKEWIGTSIEVAAKAEGVARAFRGLGDVKLLDKLREQTRGLINDFTLMQAAVKADKYKIPVSEVGNLLDFAARRAIDMGREVDDFQRRIIDGIGRQSKLVLDDLGFSSVEISRAMAKEGSFAKGVIALVNAELEKQGPRALTAADMATKATVKWENAQLKVGNQLLWINKLWSQASGKIADWVTRFAERQLPDIMNKLVDLYNHFVTAYNGSEALRASVIGITYWFKLLYNNMKLAFDFGINSAILLGKQINALMNPSAENMKEAGMAVTENAFRNAKAYKDYLDSVKKDTEDFAKSVISSKLEYITPGGDEVVKSTGGTLPDKEEKESKITARQKKELATRLENLENAHKEEILALKKYAFENNQTDEELKYETLKSDYKYYADRMQLIGAFLDEFKVKDKKFLADIGKMQADTRNSQFDLLPQFDANKLAEAERARDISLQILQAWVAGEKKTLEERNLGEEQRARELELIDIAETETRLAILQKYGMDVEALELQNGRIKAEAVKKASAETVKAEADAEAKRRALQRSDSDKNYDVRSGYGLTTVNEDKSREQRGFQDLLAANLIDYETYQKLLTQLNKKYEDERLQVKEQYGLASVSELYNMELENLKLQHEQGLLSEEEFEEAKFRLKMEYGAKWVEKYRLLQTSASGMVAALMEAETAKLDAEYDVRIAAAEGNKEEVERLENEKAQKKLDIEKKYADVQFAVKASEIIANTAVAIMTGYAQLGPIAGSVAAAMLAVTGAAQLIAANAERQKVKNMTLGGSSSDSNTQYQRINTPGLEEGGYIDVERTQDGKPFTAIYDPDKRGFVDKPTVLVGEGPAGESMEWVAGGSLVRNPTARPIIDLMDKAQTSGQASTIDMNRLIRARMAGFDTGGFISAPAASPGNNISRSGSSAALPDNRDILMEIYTFLRDNRLKAEINYQDFKTTEQIMSDYESFGNKY